MEETNVLIVEDDRALALLVSNILKDQGYRPTIIADHAEIRAAVDRVQPRCVILDGEDRSSGEGRTWTDAASLRRTHPKLPVVIFTGDGAALAEARAARSPRSVAAGFAGVISKPFVVEEFLATVKSAVAGEATESVSIFPDVGRLAADWPEEDLFGTIVHELRGPLTVMRGHMQLALGRVGRDPVRERAAIDTAMAQVDRMSALVTELLDQARIASNSLSLSVVECDLVSLVADSVAAHSFQSPPRISFLRPLGRIPVQADPARLTQILDNLIANALKYSGPETEVAVSVTVTGRAVEVRVTDHGIGVPVDEQHRLFAPFYRTTVTRHLPGTGLGLHISRKLAERHGGELRLERSSSEGTTFLLTLPARPLP